MLESTAFISKVLGERFCCISQSNGLGLAASFDIAEDYLPFCFRCGRYSIMSLERKEIFEFGEFRLDVNERTIERIDGVRNGTLTEKAFQALVLLVRRRGHLVSKDELIGFVWPDTIVEDNNLEKCVHQLRNFLGETSDGNKYIETVRKHGYRFVENVRVEQVSGTWLPETLRTDNGKHGSAGPKDLRRTESEAIVGTGSATLPVRKARDLLRRAILLSAVTLILICMSGLGYLFLRSRVEANDGEFKSKRGTDNHEAYILYLQGINLSDERGSQNAAKALGYLENAVALDPNYALAWARIALLHRDLSNASETGIRERYDKSMAAIGKALALDPNISDAYSALCHCKNRYEWDPAGAEAACRRAIELDPTSPQAHKTYGNFLFSRGRFDESIAEIRIAMEIQPVSYQNQQMYALAHYYSRRYDEAEKAFKRLLELEPGRGFIHGWLSEVMDAQGRHAEAFDYLIKKLKLEDADGETVGRFNTAYAASGWHGVLMERINTPKAMLISDSFQLACLYAKIGDKDRAFENLERAYQARSFWIAVLEVTPQLDALRDDPRYADLVRRVEGRS